MIALTTSLLLICAATTFAAALVVAQRRLVEGIARRFVRLPRFEQALLAVAVCVMTVCAQKSGTNEVANAEGEVSNAEETESQRRGEGELVTTSASPSLNLLRVNAPQAETNVFAITSFSLDRVSHSVSFTATWTSNFFDSVDSRSVDLFSSTNLLERRWTLDTAKTLDSTPPNSRPSDSFFKAAGREIVTAEFGGATSSRRQIMNQADYFYFSGHGSHATGTVQGGFTPSMAEQYWNRDLDYAILVLGRIIRKSCLDKKRERK